MHRITNVRILLPSVILLGLTLNGCNRSPPKNTASALENAADQSTPEAAAVLENAADAARDMNVSENISDPDSMAQNALEQAGNSQ